MSKKYLLITGGTGGHVLPAVNLANYLNKKNINCKIIIDKRAQKYISDYRGKVHTIYSSNLSGGIFLKFFGCISLFLGFFQSFIIILFFKPNNIISFGSYSSFSPMLSSIILKSFYKMNIYIHEQNSILGRTNIFFLNFANKLFLNFNILSNLNNKLKIKSYVVGSPEKNKLNLFKNKTNKKKFTVFIYGGSQGSEFISKFALNLIKNIDKENIIHAKFIIQCPKHMIKFISGDLQNLKSEVIIKDYFYYIEEVLNESSIVISRSGAGSVNDLINYKIPSILIPLPFAKDNHQFYNASILQKNGLAIILDQNLNELNKAKNYIYEIYKYPYKIKSMQKNFNKIMIKNSNSLIYNLITDEKQN